MLYRPADATRRCGDAAAKKANRPMQTEAPRAAFFLGGEGAETRASARCSESGRGFSRRAPMRAPDIYGFLFPAGVGEGREGVTDYGTDPEPAPGLLSMALYSCGFHLAQRCWLMHFDGRSTSGESADCCLRHARCP